MGGISVQEFDSGLGGEDKAMGSKIVLNLRQDVALSHLPITDSHLIICFPGESGSTLTHPHPPLPKYLWLVLGGGGLVKYCQALSYFLRTEPLVLAGSTGLGNLIKACTYIVGTIKWLLLLFIAQS